MKALYSLRPFHVSNEKIEQEYSAFAEMPMFPIRADLVNYTRCARRHRLPQSPRGRGAQKSPARSH